MSSGASPGYGVHPYVYISHSNMPKDQTSDSLLILLHFKDSGESHLKGSFVLNYLKHVINHFIYVYLIKVKNLHLTFEHSNNLRSYFLLIQNQIFSLNHIHQREYF